MIGPGISGSSRCPSAAAKQLASLDLLDQHNQQGDHHAPSTSQRFPERQDHGERPVPDIAVLFCPVFCLDAIRCYANVMQTEILMFVFLLGGYRLPFTLIELDSFD